MEVSKAQSEIDYAEGKRGGTTMVSLPLAELKAIEAERDALKEAAKAAVDRCPNCFDHNCTDAVHGAINAALALADTSKQKG